MADKSPKLTRPKPGEIRKFDPSIINHKGGAYVLSGLCSHSRFCNNSAAEYMVAQYGRRGIVWIGLCHSHALKHVGGDASKLP